MGFFDKLKKINIFASFGSELTDDFYDELEESLILADTGMDTTLELVEELRRRVREERIKTVEEARTCMCRCIADAMQVGDPALDLSTKPSVVLFIGVNGVGKTTTIGKIGAQLKKERKKVLLCAADTFRAAAAEQLTIWADRSGLEIIRQHDTWPFSTFLRSRRLRITFLPLVAVAMLIPPYFFLLATVRLGPLRVRALVLDLWPRTGRPLRWRMPR